VLEAITGRSLYSGIPLFKEGEDWGRVIFSLKELPVGMKFRHEGGHLISRQDGETFEINGESYIPAKEDQLLSGSSVHRSSRKSATLPSNAVKPLGKASSSLLLTQKEQDEIEYQAWKEELINGMNLFEDRLERSRIERKEECKRRLNTIMDKYQRHYGRYLLESCESVTPLLDSLYDENGDAFERELFSSSFMDKLREGLEMKQQLGLLPKIYLERKTQTGKINNSAIKKTSPTTIPTKLETKTTSNIPSSDQSAIEKSTTAEPTTPEDTNAEKQKRKTKAMTLPTLKSTIFDDQLEKLLETPRTPEKSFPDKIPKSPSVSKTFHISRESLEEIPKECFTIE